MKKLSGLLVVAALSVSAGAFAADTSVRGISLGDNAKDAKSKLEGKIVSGEMQAANKRGLSGFIETMGKTEDHELRFAARPDGSIYRIRYVVRVPLAEMSAIKASLCEKFEIQNAGCATPINFAPQDARRPRNYFEAAGSVADTGEYQISLEPLVKRRNKLTGVNAYDSVNGALRIYQLAETDEAMVYQKWKKAIAADRVVKIEQKKASKSYY